MICKVSRAMFTFVALLTTTSVPAWPRSRLDKIKSDYSAVSSQLQKHLVFDQWIDDDPKSAKLLARQWSVAGQWVAAWLDGRPRVSLEDVKAAIRDLAPPQDPEKNSEYPVCLELNKDAFLVEGPGPIGNVFIVAKLNGHYRLAWSTAQVQEASGKQAGILAAWRAEHAAHGGRGPYYEASGSDGPVFASPGKLPNDAKGHARFYIDGTYAQGAGGTVGAQISLWTWDGVTARPLVARAYTFMIDQSVRTRLEGDLLKVQQKKSFRSFYSCGSCEERQTDWTVRVSSEGIEDLGEKSSVPELDAVDELLYRVIHHKSATDIASPAAIEAANGIVQDAREASTKKDWKEFPSLGMIMGWRLQDDRNGKTLCLGLDYSGPTVFTLRVVGSKLVISDAKNTEQDCAK